MTKAKGPPVWLELFDTAQMDHVCESVRDGVEGVALGAPSSMHHPLSRWILGPLDAYHTAHWKQGRQQVHVLAAERLHEAVVHVADRFKERFPYVEGDGVAVAAVLRFAWLEFIAYGAAHRMYDDLPKGWRQRAEASKNPRGRAKGLTPAALAEELKKRGATHLTEELVAELGRAFKVGERTLYRRQEEARNLGLLQKDG